MPCRYRTAYSQAATPALLAASEALFIALDFSPAERNESQLTEKERLGQCLSYTLKSSLAFTSKKLSRIGIDELVAWHRRLNLSSFRFRFGEAPTAISLSNLKYGR